MAQGIYDLLQQTLKLTTNLNKQLCCEPTPPPTTTTTTTSTSTSTTSTSTTSTTTTPGFFRASFLTALPFANRGGLIASRASWYSGNTVSSITPSNPNLVTMQIRNNEITGSLGENVTRIIRETISSPPQTVIPSYTTFDNISNYPIMISIRDHYNHAVKMINNTFLSTRNASVFVKRVSSPNGLGSGVLNDAIFLVGIDFDATGNERDGYTYTANSYDLLVLPTTLTISNFTYSVFAGSPVSATVNNIPMGLYSPSTSWVNNVTTIPAFGITIREDFTIPPGW